MTAFLEGLHGEMLERWSPVIELGLHHEQQHQELLLTDVKYNFACNPLRPAYVSADIPTHVPTVGPLRWVSFLEGVYWIGHDGQRFAFDNEFPRHRSFVERLELASRLVTNGEYLAFMADGGMNGRSCGCPWVGIRSSAKAGRPRCIGNNGMAPGG